MEMRQSNIGSIKLTLASTFFHQNMRNTVRHKYNSPKFIATNRYCSNRFFLNQSNQPNIGHFEYWFESGKFSYMRSSNRKWSESGSAGRGSPRPDRCIIEEGQGATENLEIHSVSSIGKTTKSRQPDSDFPDGTRRPAGKTTGLVVRIKHWRGVGAWRWLANDDSCGICRMPFDACCADCKLPGDECPLVWGQCTHCFHIHCIMKWLNSQSAQQLCPMCRQEWKFRE